MLEVPEPLDLRRTVSALGMKVSGGPVVTPTEAWWATHTPQGPGTLRLASAGARLEAHAWGPGAGWLLDAAPGLIGAQGRPEDFGPPPGLVRTVHRRSPGLRIGATRRVHEAAFPVVLGQRVTTRETRLAGIRLLRKFGEPAPGPTDLRLLPNPAKMRELSYWDLHPLCVERKRAEILLEVARRSQRLEEIVDMDRTAAMERLVAIRGIGPWTAGHIMGIAWGDADAVPVGDFHLPNMVSWALAGEDRGTDDRMLDLLEPYRDHRRRVVLLLKGAGLSAPKYGPKHEIRSIERI